MKKETPEAAKARGSLFLCYKQNVPPKLPKEGSGGTFL